MHDIDNLVQGKISFISVSWSAKLNNSDLDVGLDIKTRLHRPRVIVGYTTRLAKVISQPRYQLTCSSVLKYAKAARFWGNDLPILLRMTKLLFDATFKLATQSRKFMIVTL